MRQPTTARAGPRQINIVLFLGGGSGAGGRDVRERTTRGGSGQCGGVVHGMSKQPGTARPRSKVRQRLHVKCSHSRPPSHNDQRQITPHSSQDVTP
eukprot:4245814-Prymnesium_polylepis.1